MVGLLRVSGEVASGQMKDWQQAGFSAVITGTVASLVSSTALAMLAKLEGKSAIQPLNATSHWLHGEDAAKVREADLRHTAIGYATHHGASIFWATLFEALLQDKQRTPSDIVKCAALVSSLAAAVDYGIVPKRLTPGWEEAISKPSMAAGFAAMALGLALGGMMSSLVLRAAGQKGNPDNAEADAGSIASVGAAGAGGAS
jgi:hypothetical protein